MVATLEIPDGYPAHIMDALRVQPLAHAALAPLEEDDHAHLVSWLEREVKLGTRLDLGACAVDWFHPPMGGLRKTGVSGRLWAMGARSGPSDLLFFRPFELDGVMWSGGLALELKRAKPARSSLTKKQRAFLEARRRDGWLAEVCYGSVEARALILRCYARTGTPPALLRL